ncbi:MAG: M67 family metallopeptidase [Prochlorococcus sp.]|tara:strand:- start:1044 stop:1544 length:501 start_codon:yes stop_codon:yes gene_type:complete
MPGLLEFDSNCLMVLRRNLLTVAPLEGCALLLGDQQDSHISQGGNICCVRLIWPCCNTWVAGMSSFPEVSDDPDFLDVSLLSRKCRFALDPREQLQAQRFARARNWRVLGSAHSHPGGEAVPSPADHRWTVLPALMVIVAGSGNVRAWWLTGVQSDQKHELAYLGQ